VAGSDSKPGISKGEARKLLGVLCSRYGFDLSPLWIARLENNPPRTVDKYTDTVFRAEGLDPVTADSAPYESIRSEVHRAFERSAGGP
jgi:hypothetical protein